MSLVHELGLRDTFVHELFELRTSAAPHATALRFGDAQLSYAELNARANQLARYLERQGVGRELRVVVALEPGFEIAVALLALLKSGGVYVPLDPSYPEARIRAILDDTQPSFVLTHSSLREKLAFAEARTLELDRPQPEILAQSSANLGLAIEPTQTAYVYYTSGTTGVPKGVLASHANLASYIGSAQRRYGFTHTDVGLALARFSFSISMFELMSPLVAGGTLLLLERAQVLDFARLAQALRQATFFHAGPSLLRGLLAYLERHHTEFSAFARIRHASSGGDMVPVEVLEQLLRVFEHAEVFVIYGCSEISCMGTTYPVPRAAPLDRSYVGEAFAATTFRVVDEQLRDVASGAVGEVLFAGPGVVKGYLNRPELTAERFIEQGGSRFYKTGDRGRTNERGLLELVGRSDFQVKLGGIRIELGEIEHHLRRAPGVANGVVSAKLVTGETALVAYVVVEEGDHRPSSERAATIRRYLAQQLPDYMVPAVYLELAALPLNHNLKLDRKALPEPPPWSGDAHEPTLSAIWRKLLRVERAEPGDNFFELGGTSLLALQLLLEVDRQLGVTLTGLEVLRESFGMLTELCERRSGRARSSDVASSVSGALEPFHFGPQQGLYGVLHEVVGQSPEAAVLICAPLGHEALRSHFILQQLARRLAAAGVPSLRFHYYGCEDSLGEPHDASLARWQEDIVAAHSALCQRTQAKRILGIGARLGGTLLARAAPSLSLDRLVLWDPVTQGAQHRAQLFEAQQRYVRATPLFSLRGRLAELRSKRGARELLGATYSELALRELSELVLPLPTSPCQTLASDCGWLDLARLEDMLPDVGLSQALSRLLLEPA